MITLFAELALCSNNPPVQSDIGIKKTPCLPEILFVAWRLEIILYDRNRHHKT